MRRRIVSLAIAAACAAAIACHDGGLTGVAGNQGQLEVRLKDSPFPFDSVKEVNVFVTRIDAKFEREDDDDAERRDGEHDDSLLVAHDSGSTAWWWRWLNLGERHGGFETIATPNSAFNLLELRNGASAFLGTAVVDTGRLRDLRMVIDPAKSTIVMKDGSTLTGSANPFGRFPPGAMIVLRVKIEEDVVVRSRARTVVMIDFDLNSSFVLLGPSVRLNGFRLAPGLTCRHDD